MAESSVQVTEGVGKRLHTDEKTIGGSAVQDEYVIRGEYALPTYSILGRSISIATANAHVLQIMAGAANKVRVRRIRVSQDGSVATAAGAFFELWRLSTGGSGGTDAPRRPHDTSDAAANCTAQTLPSSKGTESVLLKARRLTMQVATGVDPVDVWEWHELDGGKPIIIPTGATNGLAIKSTAAIAGGSVNVEVELVETTF